MLSKLIHHILRLLLYGADAGVPPPNPKAAVCVPAPAISVLAVFNPVGLEVQVEPSYSSVAPVLAGHVPVDNHQKLMQQFEYLLLLKQSCCI
jgi:hypothetical protein